MWIFSAHLPWEFRVVFCPYFKAVGVKFVTRLRAHQETECCVVLCMSIHFCFDWSLHKFSVSTECTVRREERIVHTQEYIWTAM